MCQVSFTSHNLCRPYLYQTHVDLVAVRESDDEECRHNSDQAVREGYTRRGNLGRN